MFFRELLEKERKSEKEKKIYERRFQNYGEMTGAMRRYSDGGKCLTIFCTMMSNIIIKLLPIVIGVHIPFRCIQIPVKNAFSNNGT